MDELSLDPSPGVLAGRGAIVTGASRGIGFAIARAFVDAGADIVVCGRDDASLTAAAAMLRTSGASGRPALVEPIVADVASPEAVARLVSRSRAILPSLDILVSNAGVLGPVGPLDEIAWDDWASSVAVNLLGPALLMRAVLPHLKAQRWGRIIQLSGGGATKPQPNRSAYAAAKAGVVRLVETVAGEVEGYGITVNAIAPGAVNTTFLDDVLAAGPDRVGEAAWAEALRQHASGGSSPDAAAALAVMLASQCGAAITGRLISAIWDDWETLPDRAAELAGSELFTLRRVTAEHLAP